MCMQHHVSANVRKRALLGERPHFNSCSRGFHSQKTLTMTNVECSSLLLFSLLPAGWTEGGRGVMELKDRIVRSFKSSNPGSVMMAEVSTSPSHLFAGFLGIKNNNKCLTCSGAIHGLPIHGPLGKQKSSPGQQDQGQALSSFRPFAASCTS